MKFELHEAIKKLEKSNYYFEIANFSWMIGCNLGFTSYVYSLLGDFDAAMNNIIKGRLLMEKTDVNWFIGIFPLVSSYIHYNYEEFSKAQESAIEAVQLSVKYDERQIEALSWISLGRIIARMSESNIAESENRIIKGIEILEELQLRPFLTQSYFHLGEFYADIERKEEAKKNLNRSFSMCREMGTQYWPDKIKEVLDRL